MQYTYWCGKMSWDLEGNFQGFVGVTSRNKPITTPCPKPDPTLTFTNAGGYTAWTTTVAGYYGYETFANPNLDTP
jgi:hypothetical protein